AHTQGPDIHRARHVRGGARLLSAQAPPVRRGVAARPLRRPRGRGPARQAAPDRRKPGAAGGEGRALLGGGGRARRGRGAQGARRGDLRRRVLRERRQRPHRVRAGGARPGRGATPRPV
ncbi:MAG: hypothetical protein AVDCRST_MAG05-2401, partial [uncultured Rubrobacteraceae bacterium]